MDTFRIQSIAMAELDNPISRVPLSRSARNDVIASIWSTNPWDDTSKDFLKLADKLNSYFRHYEDQCSAVRMPRKHSDVLRVVQLLKEARDQPLSALEAELIPFNPTVTSAPEDTVCMLISSKSSSPIP